MHEVFVPFVRGGGVVEHGYVSILVHNPNDSSEIEHTLKRGSFHNFLVQEREYVALEWNFGQPEKNDNDQDHPDIA